MTRDQLVDLLKDKIAKEITCRPQEIAVEDSFQELGLDSINSIFLLDHLERETGLELNPIDFANYPTLGEFIEYLIEKNKSGND